MRSRRRAIGRREWRAGVDERHDADRVCVDRGQQQHELVDGDGGGLGQRQRDGELQYDGECEHESAHGHAHGGWPDVQRDAGRGGVRVCDRADESIGRSRVAGTGSTSVTAQTGCAWTAVSNSTSWLTVTAGASGSGNGTVSFSAAANASTSQRTGTLTVGGQTFNVTQAGAACAYAIAPTSQSVGRGWWAGCDERHGADRVCVDRGQQQHELVDGDGGGLGERQRDGELQCDGEREHESAHGTLTVGGQTFTVTQAGAACRVCDRADDAVGRSRAGARGRRASRRRPGVRGPRSATA